MSLANVAAFIACLGVGCGVLYANPKRAINRAFFFASLFVGSWLACLQWLTLPANPDTVAWLRATFAVGAFFPFLLWVIKDCAKGRDFGWLSFRSGWPWLLTACLTAALCFSHYFIPAESTPEHHVRGQGWHIYVVVTAISYLVLLFDTISDQRRHEGIQKIELQILLFGGIATGLTGIVLSTVGQITENSNISHLIPFVIAVFYSATAWSITTQKVFDARHLLNTAIQGLVSVGIVAVIFQLGLMVDQDLVPRPLVVILCAVLVSVIFTQLNRRVVVASQLGGDREAEAVRLSILAAGRDEFEHDRLVRKFSAILSSWGVCDRTYLLQGQKQAFVCPQFSIDATSAEGIELLSLAWATPESLQRQREGPGRNRLAAFMAEHRLGVMICSPSNDGLASFIIALQVRRNRIPYTWSEIKALEGWAGVMENIFSRIQFTQQARESEQLRTAGLLGASLAHEIRNPLVTLKTIAQSARARYNDPEFKRLLIELVPTEIERIEGLVSGLMDLGRPQHPHFEQIHINEVVETSVKLVKPKALDESVLLECELRADHDEVKGDRSSVRQIILNLVMNAIQAVEVNEGQRRVCVRTEGGADAVVIEVHDNGPGMPPEVRERLFQPFTTSNKTSGMGLGLAITADLVRLHHGEIALVDGQEAGTTFRVTLPCQQPSS